jgi:hypothetical protein
VPQLLALLLFSFQVRFESIKKLGSASSSGNLIDFGLSDSNDKCTFRFKKIDMGIPKFANPKLQMETS